MGRICFFNTTPFWGGGEKWHLTAAVGLRDRGYPVVLVGSPSGPLVTRARSQGIDTAEFRLSGWSWLDPLERRRLKRFFVQREVQTVVFNGPVDLKAGGLAARAAGVRQRVYRRGLALPVRARWLNRYLFENVLTHVVANSQETRRLVFQELGPVLPPERVAVIYNGIDLAAFDHGLRVAAPRGRHSAGPTRVIGTAGRLTRQKNHMALLEVARILTNEGVDFTLRVAGDGELAGELHQRAGELGLRDRVDFLGFVEDMPGFLSGIDVFVLTSSWEGFGYVLVEAGAAQRPSVAFDVSSNPEVVADGVTGFLLDPGDLPGFAQRVKSLLDDVPLRTRMGAAARRDVEARFTVGHALDQLERFLGLERPED